MDPDETIDRIADHIARHDFPAAFDACADLYGWLRGGGYEPDWALHMVATDYYNAWLIVTGRN